MIDAYGATEGGVAVNRDAEERAGALGQVGDNVQVVDDEGKELPRARFDAEGRLVNADECVGEIVNTAGAGPFEGYYNNDAANERTLRFGWYWTGDLGYLDDDRYLYFAGRNADWLRVDGENFPAQPIETAIGRHPDVVLAAVYGVPDDQAGDQVMAGIVLREGASFDPVAFATWVDALDDVGPKWRPRYVRVLRDPPTTGTNKIIKRTLVHEKWRADRVGGDPVFIRLRDEPAYRELARTRKPRCTTRSCTISASASGTSEATAVGDVVEVVGFDHLVLKVADVERSLDFYCGTLGLAPERVDEWRAGDVLFPSVRITDTAIIDLLAAERTGDNVDHFCLVIAPTDLAALAASGVFDVVGDGPADGLFGAQGVASSLYVRDPDGNVVELRSY